MKKIFVFITVSAFILGTAVLAGAQVLEGDGILDSVADSGWNIQTVDSTGDVGYETSLALDAGGNAHISYYDATNADLKYAAWTGSSWNIETVDSEGTVGRQSSLALDSSGYPHISYSYRYWYNYDSLYDLKYAAWNSPTSSWEIETAESGGNMRSSSLALDSSDYPHIAYYRYWPYGNDVMYTYWDGLSWSDQVVDDGQGAAGLSLALDRSGYPHISYYDYDDHGLRYAWWNGSSWSSTLLDTTTSLSTSLALDSSEYPHISYLDYTNGNLKYVKWDGSEWHIQTVDNSGDVGYGTSLALDGSGSPHIVYYDETNQDLSYAAWDGSGWAIETVDSTGDVGLYASLALDGSGNPHISYFDHTNGDLKYAFLPRVDTTPPTINSVSASPDILWPVNHKMVEATVTVEAEDICDPGPVSKIVGVTSNEPINGLGDGNTEPDWEITGELTVKLRAERAGGGTGRVYTIHIECADLSGNTASGSVDVSVPHDQGKGKK